MSAIDSTVDSELEAPKRNPALASWFRILLVVLALGVAGAYALPRYVEQMPRTKDADTRARLESAAKTVRGPRFLHFGKSVQLAASLRKAGIPAVAVPADVTVAAITVAVKAQGVTLSLASPTGKHYVAFVATSGQFSVHAG